MLTIEDRILRLELLTGVVDGIPKELMDIDLWRKYKDEYGFYPGRTKYIQDYFERKESK